VNFIPGARAWNAMATGLGQAQRSRVEGSRAEVSEASLHEAAIEALARQMRRRLSEITPRCKGGFPPTGWNARARHSDCLRDPAQPRDSVLLVTVIRRGVLAIAGGARSASSTKPSGLGCGPGASMGSGLRFDGLLAHAMGAQHALATQSLRRRRTACPGLAGRAANALRSGPRFFRITLYPGRSGVRTSVIRARLERPDVHAASGDPMTWTPPQCSRTVGPARSRGLERASVQPPLRRRNWRRVSAVELLEITRGDTANGPMGLRQVSCCPTAALRWPPFHPQSRRPRPSWPVVLPAATLQFCNAPCALTELVKPPLTVRLVDAHPFERCTPRLCCRGGRVAQASREQATGRADADPNRPPTAAHTRLHKGIAFMEIADEIF